MRLEISTYFPIRNRMRLSLISLMSTFVLLLGCTNQERSSLDSVYKHQAPIARIVNLPILARKDIAFSLEKKTAIHIYAIGESDIKLVSVPQKYLYKGDDVELYFKINNVEIPPIILNIKLDTSLKQVKIQDGYSFSAIYDSKLRKYILGVRVSYSKLNNFVPSINNSFEFNIAIGDNDDKLLQKAKIAWTGNVDPLFTVNKKYGRIILSENNKCIEKKDGTDEKFITNIMNIDENKWNSIKNTAINNLVFGQINDSEDLSANFKCQWGSDAVYLLLEINDGTPVSIDFDDLVNMSRFHDYGWIEDKDGKIVWNMKNLNTKHAGGADKNRLIDTVVNLNAGKYHLKYLTDESHSWNNWDDRPPYTPFYGILLYKNNKD